MCSITICCPEALWMSVLAAMGQTVLHLETLDFWETSQSLDLQWASYNSDRARCRLDHPVKVDNFAI